MGCAPEPTTPATTDLAGVWTSNSRLSTLSNFQLNLIQEPQGIVSGGWSAKGEGTGVPAGNVIGLNTVAQVELHLLGAGRFDGVFIEPQTLRGVISVTKASDTITFVRLSR